MEYTFAQQSAAFLFSVLLGGALWFVYEALKIIRLGFSNPRPLVAALDILFMAVSAAATFLFALAFLNGSVRFYMILGESAGFFLLRLTLGRAFERITFPVLKFMKKIFLKIANLFKKISEKLLKISFKVVYNVFEKIYKFVSSFKNLFKNKKNKNIKGIDHGRQKKKDRSKSVPKQNPGGSASQG